MRPGRRLRPFPESPRLAEVLRDDRRELWTETVGESPSVYGERWAEFDRRTYRLFEPGRSKLAAAVVRGWSGILPSPGQRWLYLGAASGTTASHVADLVGPDGRVYAVEKSIRPFARLLSLAHRWPNLRPILADARDPDSYEDLVPLVDGVYADVAQPDQLEIFRRNVELLAKGPGTDLLLALKTASMGRSRTALGHRDMAEESLGDVATLVPSISLEPFHKGHFMMGGRWGEVAVPSRTAPHRATRPIVRRRGRSGR